MLISLRQRLTFTLLGLVLVFWLISVVVTAGYAYRIMTKQLDEHLNHSADMIGHTMKGIMDVPAVGSYFEEREAITLSSQQVTRIPGFSDGGHKLAINMIFDERTLIVGESGPHFPTPQQAGIRNVTIGDGDNIRSWRVLYRYDDEVPMWLIIGTDTSSTEVFGDSFFLRTLIPLLVMLPITIAILLFGIKQGLRPLNYLAKEVARRNPLTLELLDEKDVPLEVQPLAQSLNDLLRRLHRALESEQRFTADAAHELQTPLAAIKTELQFCQRAMAEEKDRIMIERIEKRVSRATETVTQLLTLARLDPQQNFSKERVALRDLTTDVLAELGNQIFAQDIDLQLIDGNEMWIEGHAEWLKILLRNLLSNALRYTPMGGLMEIDILAVGDKRLVKIMNDCGEISAVEFERLTDRFYRSPGTTKHGVGLGLSIVQRIAELHGATLVLGRWHENTGFKAQVSFNAID